MPPLALVAEFPRWISWFPNGNFRRRIYFCHRFIGWIRHTIGNYRLLDFDGVDPYPRIHHVGKRRRYSINSNALLEHVPALGKALVARLYSMETQTSDIGTNRVDGFGCNSVANLLHVFFYGFNEVE